MKTLPTILLPLVLVLRLHAADAPVVGVWKPVRSDAELTVKSDGTGTVKSSGPAPRTVPFKWQKTADGALLEFAADTEFGSKPSLRVGSNPNEVMFKTAKEEIKLERASEKRKEIERYFRVTNMDQRIAQSDGMFISSLKVNKTNVPAATWKTLEDKFSLAEVRDEIIAEYEAVYTLDELKAINAFYESPAGKKELSMSPGMWQHAIILLMGRADKIAREAESPVQK